MAKIIYEPIGVIHTPFTRKEKTPIQGVFSPDSTGEVEVFPQYIDGLKDIAGYSHLILIYHFHLAEGAFVIHKPFLDYGDKGIFSIRHYNRPNPIGLSVVRLDEVKGNILRISEVDILDGTPLLDIKPYVPDFDIRYNATRGWHEYASNWLEYLRNKGIPEA